MLKIDEQAMLQFSNMGLFVSDEEWMHPAIANPTHELIFVTKGVVYIEEGGKRYELTEGDLLCLRPEIMHRGYKKSSGVSFFWLHFWAENYEYYGVYREKLSDAYNGFVLMKQLNHLSTIGASGTLIESKLLAFLSDLKHLNAEENKLYHDVREYVRVHIASRLKVKEVADKFAYNSDYLSKVFIKSCGLSLKQYIDKERVSLICDRLLNTTTSLKEIAEYCSFEDDNALIKFFTRRVGRSPSRYRNGTFATHINRK